jgi:hypothetical protein
MPAEVGAKPALEPRQSREVFAIALVVAAAMLLYLCLATDGVDPLGSDWAMYAMHARNLVAGHAYGDTFYVYQPETAMYGGATYPTGYALLLAPVYALFGMNILAFKIVTDLALALSLVPIFLFCRRYLGVVESLLLVCAIGFGGPYLTVQDKLGSDQLFQLLSFTALTYIIGLYESGRDRLALSGVIAGLLLSAVELTRPVGMALILAVLLYDVARARRVTRFAIIVIAIFAPVIVLNNLIAHKDSSYAEQFVFSLRHIVEISLRYAAGFSNVFSNPLSHKLRYALWLAATPLAVAGLLVSLRKLNPLAVLYAALTLGVLAIYWAPNYRYLLPLFPIYLFYAALGWNWLESTLPAAWKRPAQALAIGCLLIAPILSTAAIRPDHSTLITDPNFTQLAQTVRVTAGPHDLTVFWNARVLALAAERPASSYPSGGEVQQSWNPSSPEAVLRFLARVRPAYVVWDGGFTKEEHFLAEAMTLEPERFKPVYQNARFKLMRYLPK